MQRIVGGRSQLSEIFPVEMLCAMHDGIFGCHDYSSSLACYLDWPGVQHVHCGFWSKWHFVSNLSPGWIVCMIGPRNQQTYVCCSWSGSGIFGSRTFLERSAMPSITWCYCVLLLGIFIAFTGQSFGSLASTDNMYVAPGLALAFLAHVQFWSVPLCQASPDATVFYDLEFLLRLQDSHLGVWPAQTSGSLLRMHDTKFHSTFGKYQTLSRRSQHSYGFLSLPPPPPIHA